MISLQDIAHSYGLNDEEAADILNLDPFLRRIGLDNYLVNAPIEASLRRTFAPYKKKENSLPTKKYQEPISFESFSRLNLTQFTR